MEDVEQTEAAKHDVDSQILALLKEIRDLLKEQRETLTDLYYESNGMSRQ